MSVEETDDVKARGSRFLEVLSSLPKALRPVYTELVEDYKFYALARCGKAWVAYDIIADLVRAGWRVQRLSVSWDRRELDQTRKGRNDY